MRSVSNVNKIISPRRIWKNEVEFSDWLAKQENLNYLGKALGIKMIFKERESFVGKFRADIYAVEKGTQKTIIIENQIHSTNHDHLGKIVTHASGKNAGIIIWIANKANNEHKEAIKWLNNHLDTTLIYLVTFNIFATKNSKEPTISFQIVEQPNSTKTYKQQIVDIKNDKSIREEFWKQFCVESVKNKRFTEQFKPRLPKNHTDNYLSVGHSGCHIKMQFMPDEGTISIQLIFHFTCISIYKRMERHKITINRIIGKPLWIRDKNIASLMLIRRDIDVLNKTKWGKCIRWLCSKALKFKGIVDDYNF